MLRHAATNHIFKEIRKGVVVHTAASRMLAEDSQMRDWVVVNCEEMWPAAERVESSVQLLAIEGMADLIRRSKP